jgi:hypothetical protein
MAGINDSLALQRPDSWGYQMLTKPNNGKGEVKGIIARNQRGMALHRAAKDSRRITPDPRRNA